MIKKFAIFLVIVLVIAFSKSAIAGDVSGIRFWQDPEKTRLVFDLSEAVDYKLFTLENPHRLVIDIEKSQLKTDIGQVEIPKPLVQSIRSSRSNDTLRIVMDLQNGVTAKDFTLKPYQRYGHRLVVDLADAEADAKKTVVISAEAALKNKNRDIIIAIDPGHGGEDPGALGG